MIKKYISLYIDINECTINISGCSQNCTNIIGGYHCSCYSGYQFAADLRSCLGELYKCNANVGIKSI